MLAPENTAPREVSFFKRVLNAWVGATNPIPRARPFSEQGVSGTAVYGGYVIQREKSPEWIGRQRYVTISDMAVNASIIAAGVHYFLNLIAHPRWNIEPADESAEAEKVAEYVDECLNDLTQPWSRVVRRMATFRFYGFGVQEWTAKKRKKDNRVGLLSIEPRPQHTIERWDVEEDGSVAGVWQRSPQTGVEYGIPRSKIVYLVDDVLSDSPEGVGLFRHLADPWTRLKQYYDLETRAFERDLRGTPIGRVPYTQINQAVAEGIITQAKAESMVEAMEKFVKLQVKQSDTAITLDSIPYFSQAADGSKVAAVQQWGLELLQGGAAGMAEVAAAIVRTQQEMARILTCENLMMGESSGNRALAEDKSRNLYLVANAVLSDMAAAVTQDVFPALCDLNGIPEELRPKARVEDVAFKDADSVAATLQKMAQAGAVLAPDDPVIADVRSLMGVSPPAKIPPEMLGIMKPGERVPGEEDEDEAGDENENEDADETAADEARVPPGLRKYDPSQPRDPKGTPTGGRWTSAGGAEGAATEDGAAGISSEGAAQALLEQNLDPSVTLESLMAQATEQQRQLAAAARAAQAAGTSTRELYQDESGRYTPEREALHEEILTRMFSPEAINAAMPAAGERPEFVMTGGRPAAGKTTALMSGGLNVGAPKYIVINQDDIQEHLPGYRGDRAGLYTAEAGDIADKAEHMARELGVNVVQDGTMKSAANTQKRVDLYKAAGYDVSAYFIHTAPHVSAKRTLDRFAHTGRFVPPEISLNSRSNEAAFDSITPQLKRWALFDNNGTKPRLVAKNY